jgi:uncharacterized membrane protein YeiH
LFGAAVIGFVTALGGGTTRDVILDSHPVSWIENPMFALLVLLAVPFTYVFRRYLIYMTRTMFIFDTIGIALFTISGMQKALSLGLHPLLAMAMGVVSAVVGGVIRDILCNEIPLIFRKEIYAMACFIGALVFYWLQLSDIPTNINYLITIALIIGIRIISIKKNLSMPKMK